MRCPECDDDRYNEELDDDYHMYYVCKKCGCKYKESIIVIEHGADPDRDPHDPIVTVEDLVHAIDELRPDTCDELSVNVGRNHISFRKNRDSDDNIYLVTKIEKIDTNETIAYFYSSYYAVGIAAIHMKDKDECACGSVNVPGFKVLQDTILGGYYLDGEKVVL